MALSDNRKPFILDTDAISGGHMGAVTDIFQGSLCIYEDGLIVPAKPVVGGGHSFAGVAEKHFQNPSGVAGGARVELSWRTCGGYIDATDSFDETHIGKDVYIKDSDTLTKTDNSGAHCLGGKLVRIKDGIAFFRPRDG